MEKEKWNTSGGVLVRLRIGRKVEYRLGIVNDIVGIVMLGI